MLALPLTHLPTHRLPTLRRPIPSTALPYPLHPHLHLSALPLPPSVCFAAVATADSPASPTTACVVCRVSLGPLSHDIPKSGNEFGQAPTPTL